MLRGHSFMDRPVPDLSDLRLNKSLCRSYPLEPIEEACLKVNGKLLCRSYYWHYNPRPSGAREEIFLRKTLLRKIESIDQKLCPLGFSLLIQEGYRPLPVQQFSQEVAVVKKIKEANPEALLI